MVPGLIKLTGVDGTPFYFNPQCISLFTPSTPGFVAGMGGNPDSSVKGASVIVVSGLPLQVRESNKDIISALVRLRKKGEDHMLAFKKELEREDWMDDDDFQGYPVE